MIFSQYSCVACPPTSPIEENFIIRFPVYEGDEDLVTHYGGNMIDVGTSSNTARGPELTPNATFYNVMNLYLGNYPSIKVFRRSGASYTVMASEYLESQLKAFGFKDVTRYNYQVTSATDFYATLSDGNDYSGFCKAVSSTDAYIGIKFYILVYEKNFNKFVCFSFDARPAYTGHTFYFEVIEVNGATAAGTPFPATILPDYNPSDPGTYTSESDVGGGQTREPSAGGTIGLPSLPTISSIGTGLLQLYNPSRTQLVSLGRYLWSNNFNLDNLKKLFSNPMDVILGLSIFPVAIPSAGSENIMLGNLDSGVSANTASQQYVSKDFGTLDVDEYYGNYLDYDPYTRIEIFLPYIGMKELSPDDVMGKTISLNYSIDLLSGACVAHIRVDGKLTYEFSGICNTQIPITSLNYTSVITGILGMVGGALATGAVAIGGIKAAATEAAVAGAGMKGLLGMGASTAASVMSQKRRYEHSGSIGSAAGYLAGQTPYLLITTPRWCKPGEQPHFTGYPGFLYRQVSQLSGFTIFVNFEVTEVHCTQGELDEIIDWFTNKGVRI